MRVTFPNTRQAPLATRPPQPQPLAQPSFPSLPAQAATLARAAGQLATAALRREPLAADQAEVDRRKAICDACPNQTGGRCRLCGCFLEFKRRLAVWHCPDTPRRW